jgi:hypothetical protein
MFEVLIVAVVASEALLYFSLPRALAWLAVVPFGRPRRLRFRSAAALGLIESSGEALAYRQRPSERLALERIDDIDIHAPNYSAWIRPSERRILISFHRPARIGNRYPGLAVIQLTPSGRDLIAITRQAPLPFVLFLALTALSFIAVETLPLLLFVVALFLLSLRATRSALANARNECLAELQGAIDAGGNASAG